MSTETPTASQGQPEGEAATEQLEQNPVETSAAETESEADAGEGQPQDQGEGDEGNQPKKQPWFMSRIERQAAKLTEAYRQLDEYKRLLSAGEGTEGEQQQPKGVELTADHPLVQEAARRLAEQNAINAEADKAYAEGTSRYTDFTDKIRVLPHIEGFSDQVVEAALATGSAADVLYTLASDPDEASRILALPPTRMAVELTKLATKPAAQPKRPVSSAPAPIKPVEANRSTASKDPSTMTTAEFIAWRNQTTSR